MEATILAGEAVEAWSVYQIWENVFYFSGFTFESSGPLIFVKKFE